MKSEKGQLIDKRNGVCQIVMGFCRCQKSMCGGFRGMNISKDNQNNIIL